MGRPRGRSVHWSRHDRDRNLLADSLKRYLLITHRSIPLDRIEDYAQLWREVRHRVSHAGGRAWMYRAQNVGHRFVEFVEWQSDEGHPLIERGDIASALDALNAAFAARESETWIEAKI